MTELIRERYEPVEVVGRGGQGEVVRAMDRLHDRPVALKIRETGSVAERETLLREAGILLAVRPHPNLPLVREDFIDGDRSYVVMDWIEGRNLSQVLVQDGTPGIALERVLDYVGQAAEALDHLHDHDPPVIHGDVKPTNLILRSDGSVVLVDFGISTRWGTADRSRGRSPGYDAPELATGPATPASDVFSLAATAYALVTGDRPRPEVKPRLPALPEVIAEDVLRALRRGLAADPARRPPSARTLAESIRAAARGRPVKRRRTVWITAASVAVAAAAVAVAVLTRARMPDFEDVVVGNNPAGVIANAQTNRVYVANFGSRSVSVIDGVIRRVVAKISVGARPEAIAVNPRTNTVYVANGDATVSVIDGATNSVASTVSVGSRPQGVAVNPRTNKVYVATQSGVSVIDGATDQVTTRVTLSSSPRGVAVSPEAGRLYVTGVAPNTVSVFDSRTNALLGEVAMPERPCGIAVSHRENLVYVAGRDSGSVFVINGSARTIVERIRVGSGPCGLAVNAKGKRVYIGHDSGILTAIDGETNRVVAKRQVVRSTRGESLLNQVTVDPSTNRLYLVDNESNRVLILSESDLGPHQG